MIALRNATNQAEKSWEAKKQQIAHDTEATIEASKVAIVAGIDEAKIKLQELQRQIIDSNKEFQKLQDTYTIDKRVLEHAIEMLDHDKKVLVVTNTGLQDNNRTLQSEIIVAHKTIDDLNTTIGILKGDLDSATEQKRLLEDSVITLQSQSDTLTTQVEQLQDDIRTKTEQYTTDIVVLEQKKQDLITEIVEDRVKDDKVRENLALWSKTLDEHDKNLRIREAKVNEQERSVARNYNLLNL